ncbi:hypothetical protein CLOHYLEM_04048 [[Clostridium] hylemonae DSM 15053]|uniref:Uncharacterized protein n=1 Tax=[Clostridium] hylemonae DSM 15053 TaxID=553973 RepID=C0BW43_9FIRM|nr:hypothetical protein CLOHYLEM_04048 [[Clostridium] hylemonae DSM 15053]
MSDLNTGMNGYIIFHFRVFVIFAAANGNRFLYRCCICRYCFV